MRLLNRFVVATLPVVPKQLVRYFAGRYIAGETIKDAVETVRLLNGEGVCATLDVLGEDTTSEDEALRSRNQSNEVLDVIVKESLDANLSIKLSSLGLKLDVKLCERNVGEILKAAAKRKIFVRFDMEDSTCTTDTIGIFQRLHKKYPLTGIVVQAYLRRTEDDVRELLKSRTNFRLCKGIYKERPEIAFQQRDEVQHNYTRLLEMILKKRSYVGIATHDTVLIDAAEEFVRQMKLRRSQYEFQMLLGVRPELRKRLIRAGHKVRLYVPFGEHWYGYSTRRFKENPEIAGYVFKALFVRNQ